MDENKEVNSTDPKREKVRVIPLSAIDDAPDHPFGVRDDEEMAELVESISTFGVINPVIVRKGEGERYELMATVVRRNERSWAIDLISKINLIAKNNDLVIKKAGGENTISTKLVATADRDAFCCGVSIEELKKRGHSGALSWIEKFAEQRNGVRECKRICRQCG